MPLEVNLLDKSQQPLYQKIASKSLRLKELGLSNCVIAARLCVDEKTVAKAIAWLN